jgi:hypothetical protein
MGGENMSKLHVFIDGTWLFKIVDGSVFDRFIDRPEFLQIDFNKLNNLMLNHIIRFRPDCNQIGDCYFVTSIFDLPDDFDTWVGKTINSPYGEKSITVYQNNIDETKRRIEDRAEFAQYAIDAVKCTHRVGHKF